MTVETIGDGRELLVKLRGLEVLIGAIVGVHRAVEVIENGRENRARDLDKDGHLWTRMIEGTIAELAVARALDRFWGGAGNGKLTGPKAAGGDVGRLQVRCRLGSPLDQTKRLIIQERDQDGETFVLAVGRAPSYRIVGFIDAGEAKRHAEWIQNPGGRGEAWFVPQAALNDLRYLPAAA
jgi:hypothetical protein